MKYKVVRWREPHFGIDGIIELEPIEEEKPTHTYKVGDKVRVVAAMHGHGFSIGSVQEIEDVTSTDYKLKGNTTRPYVDHHEIEPYTEQDDSWNVKPNDWLLSDDYKNMFDFCNSKLKPWVDKVKELEARNKELEHSVDVYKDTLRMRIEQLSETHTKYTALKDIADRMVSVLKGLYGSQNITEEYEKLTK